MQIVTDFIHKSSSRSLLVKNIFHMGGGFFLQTFIRVLYFLYLAKLLQPAEYGKFVAAQALVLVFVPFTNWGSGNILIKYVSRKKETFPLYWGNALSLSLLFGFINICLVLVVGNVFFSLNEVIKIVLPVAVGDLIGLSLTNVSGQAFQAFERLSATALLGILLILGRFFMLIIFAAIPVDKSVDYWVLFYMMSSLLIGLSGVFWVNKKLGAGQFGFKGMRGNWLEGFYFSVSLSSQGIYNDIDKTILNRYSSPSIAGAYGASYRVVDAAFIPVRSIIYATYPRFFQHGEKSLGNARKYAFRLMPVTITLSLFAWLGLYFLTPYLILFLGDSYTLMLEILPWLAPILLFRSIHYLLANALTGAGFQGVRSSLHLLIAVINLGLNFWLIPSYGWIGAVWSSLFSDGGFVLVLLITIWILQNKHHENKIFPNP